jgi:glutathione S-transferase
VLTIWGRKSSFNLQKVMWLVDELNVPHDHIQVGGSFGGLDAPTFRAMNPHGKVPVIDDDNTVVWESHAILRYLATRYGRNGFRRDDAAYAANDDQWLDWQATRLQPDFLMGVFWGFYRTPAPKRDPLAVARSIAACSQHFTLIDGMLDSTSCVLGDELRLADISIGTCLYRYLNLDIERPRLPNLDRYYAALCERLAYRQHVMIPFDDLFGRLDF